MTMSSTPTADGSPAAGDRVRHILSLSGGKDSTALAIYMRDRVPDMEYVFCDTHKELPETYEYLTRIEAFLGKPVVRLSDERGFDHWLSVFSGYLPSSQMRWCTRYLKIYPFERYVGGDRVFMYVGIRADEDRTAYVSSKPNITAVYPLKEAGIGLTDVNRILSESGVGFPSYYSWRTRSGCYFCFFQRRHEWVGLREHHPELYELAKSYEKIDPDAGMRFNWTQRESLSELEQPARVAEIKKQHEMRMKTASKWRPNQPLVEILAEAHDLESDAQACSFCHD